MTTNALVILIILFFVTSIIGVVTGSNSLVTVPVMFQFGIEPKTAVATNMFGLLFLSIGGTLPFLGKGIIDKKRLPKLILITLVGSAIGAVLVGLITGGAIKIIVSVSMIAVSIFTLLKRDAGLSQTESISTKSLVIAYVITFLMAIYGGLFSGGYVTVLTASYVAFFGMTYTQAIAETKIINIFSSAIASAIFMWQGLIDYKLGIILAVVMFIGAYIGAKTVTKLNDLWLKRIFLSTVLLLAVKTILDFTL
ncbi:MAG TPA: sulfite exporter TauE/SafE family protein [Pyrinomonadaceae bacterium]|mgnify:CR=1 FL=1|nr:sulfite exporter TauE/SafE family protein [Pyrinomonadaceae bacterium]